MAVIMRNPLIFGIILIVSLATNLFLGGVAIGWYMQKVHDRGPPFSQEWNNPPAILDALPEARERIQPILRQNKALVHPKIQQLQQAKREVHRQMRADEFDVTALANAFAQLRQTELAAKTAIHQVFIEVMSTLTKEERQRLDRRLPRHEEFRGPRGGPPPEGGRFRPPFLKMEDLFEERDQNGDGKLSREEFFANVLKPGISSAEQDFKKLDANSDGFITQDELPAIPPLPSPPRREFEDF